MKFEIKSVPKEFSIQEQTLILSEVIRHRPVGIHRHFAMLCILDGLKRAGVECSSENVWSYLRTLYNLEKLEEMEPVMPLIKKRIDFDTTIEKFFQQEKMQFRKKRKRKKRINKQKRSCASEEKPTTSRPKLDPEEDESDESSSCDELKPTTSNARTSSAKME
ncbi:unnamed protein product [Soboliphyme baturini]|uniref:ARID domain-containing protein n=1 Tax=Soboliphyme baturini TaxID=241478 RepID=A0A183J1X4_9BILA|nr:unnamed protein product [Soboliphyme baturini]